METFEKLDVWKLARILALDIYRNIKRCRDFSFRAQMQRSAISIPCNIAEGVERNSQAELRSFLGVAKGSAGELRTQIIIAKDLDYLEGEAFERLMEASVRVSQMLGGLIRSIETGSLPGRPKIPNPRSS